MSSSKGPSQPRDRTYISHVSCAGRHVHYLQHHLGSPTSVQIYLFIFGCIGSLLLRAGFLQLRKWGLLSSCGAWVSPHDGFSCGAQALEHTSSEVTVCEHRLCSCAQGSCSRWNLPEHGLKSMSPALGRRILNHWTTREAPTFSSLTRLTNPSKYTSEQKQPHEAEAALA